MLAQAGYTNHLNVGRKKDKLKVNSHAHILDHFKEVKKVLKNLTLYLLIEISTLALLIIEITLLAFIHLYLLLLLLFIFFIYVIINKLFTIMSNILANTLVLVDPILNDLNTPRTEPMDPLIPDSRTVHLMATMPFTLAIRMPLFKGINVSEFLKRYKG